MSSRHVVGIFVLTYLSSQLAFHTESSCQDVLCVLASWIFPRADVYAPRARLPKRDRRNDVINAKGGLRKGGTI